MIIINNGHEFEQAPGNAEGQGYLTCCSPQGHKESDTTERLDNNKKTTMALAYGVGLDKEICTAENLSVLLKAMQLVIFGKETFGGAGQLFMPTICVKVCTLRDANG